MPSNTSRSGKKKKLDHVAKLKAPQFLKNYLEGVFHMEMGEHEQAFTCLHRNFSIDLPSDREKVKNSLLFLINICLAIVSIKKNDLEAARSYLNGNISAKLVAYVIIFY